MILRTRFFLKKEKEKKKKSLKLILIPVLDV